MLAFAVNLMDGDGPNVVKLDQKKRLNISRLDKIFKVRIKIYRINMQFDISFPGSRSSSIIRRHANSAIFIFC